MSKDTAKPHGKNLRKGRFSEPNRIYLITIVTLNREPVFLDLFSARNLVKTLKGEQERNRSETLAYVVMPDHLHRLIQLRKDADLSKTVVFVKSIFAHRMGKQIWQKGYHDHAIHKEVDLKALARYIVSNPIRAGLVNNIAEYPHWDAVWL